jgi:hypothetical protein
VVRNFTTHSKLPIARGKFTWTRDAGETSTVALNKGTLLEWDGWNAAARTFLDASDEDIDLRDVVREYAALVHSFNEWFGRAFVGGHLPAFDELTARVRRRTTTCFMN